MWTVQIGDMDNVDKTWIIFRQFLWQVCFRQEYLGQLQLEKTTRGVTVTEWIIHITNDNLRIHKPWYKGSNNFQGYIKFQFTSPRGLV